jgi:AraC-like DNA-binding protein
MADAVETIRPIGFRAWTGRARMMASEHAHGDVEINFSPMVTLRYLLGGVTASIPPGRLGVFWGAVPHRLIEGHRSNDDAMGYWVTVPLQLLLGWSLPDTFTRDLLAGKMLIDRASPAADALQLTQWAADLTADSPTTRQRTAALEVEARLRRMAIDHGWTTPVQRPGRHLADHDADDPAQRMARFIAERYADDISIDDIAGHVSLHPRYAMTLFRRRMGSTLAEHLTRQRVAHAQRLLVTTDRPVLDIGFDAGFGSVSRYYAAFKRLTGRSPRAYRVAVRPRP